MNIDQYFTTEKENAFLGLFKVYVQREGWQDLLQQVETRTDFFTAPASTRHHGAYEEGLLDHSLHVCYRLHDLRRTLANQHIVLSEESCTICALLHDICKANQYHKEKKWQKNDVGQWEEKMMYVFKDDMPLGHGEKSVMMILPYMRLTAEEQLAIRWHMGRFDTAADSYNGLQTLGAAQRAYPLVTALHLANMMATWFDETEYDG